MASDKLLDALAERVPFRTARRLLVASDYPTGQGWDAIREKIKDPAIRAKANASKLKVLYGESLLATEKAVKLFTLDSKQRAALSKKLNDNLAASQGISAAQNFPFPLGKAALQVGPPSDPAVVGKVSIPGGEAFVISYVREQSFRVAISPTQISAAAGIKYSEAYAIQVERIQSFDAIILIDSEDKVFHLTDAPSGMTGEMLAGSFARVRTFVKGLAKGDLFSTPENLLPAIKPFYSDSAVQVSFLDHTSPDTSMRSERMRGSAVCLRDADFHKAGMAASNGMTDAFGIGVLWKLSSVGRIEARPELIIAGGHSITYSLNPGIEHAYISKAATYQELKTVLISLASKV